MRLEVDGVQYTNFTQATCEIRLDALTNTFSFEAVAPSGEPLPFKGGEECKVIVDGEKVLTGFIEVVAVNYDGANHTINVSGRDKTADLLDSTIDTIDDLRGDNLTLKSVIEKVIDHLGLSIKVIDQVTPKAFSAAEDIASPEPGENAFSFIEKYARKRQVLLTSNGDGDIVIATNSGVNASGAVQHIIGADDNNVINSSFSFDTTGRFNAYKAASGLNPIALNQAGDSDLASLVNQSGGVFDSAIRAGRQLILISETPFSDSNCTERAKWEADVRKARGLAYSAAVPGFRVAVDSGDLWQTNRIYQIVDDFVGKIEPMLCNSVTFSFDLEAGRQSTLGFVGQKAYTLVLEDDTTVEVATNVS
jgi:prophage tail gpP-like protein